MSRSLSLGRLICVIPLLVAVGWLAGCGGSSETAPIPQIQVQGINPASMKPSSAKEGDRPRGSESGRDPALGPVK
jgi:hypothetical protein